MDDQPEEPLLLFQTLSVRSLQTEVRSSCSLETTGQQRPSKIAAFSVRPLNPSSCENGGVWKPDEERAARPVRGGRGGVGTNG